MEAGNSLAMDLQEEMGMKAWEVLDGSNGLGEDQMELELA